VSDSNCLDTPTVEESQIESYVVTDDGEVSAGGQGRECVLETLARDNRDEPRVEEVYIGLIINEQPDTDDLVLSGEARGLQVKYDWVLGAF
jgi:hypothetical protein